MPRGYDDLDELDMSSHRSARSQQGRMDGRDRRPAGRMDNSQSMSASRQRARRKKSQMTSIIILIVEVIVFIALLITFFVLKNKIENGDGGKASTTQSSSEQAGGSNGVNVESDDFTLTCTKVQLANDIDGNPAALIFFTFVNKTDTPLSMFEVFPPSLKQNGVECMLDANLAEYPTEYSNKDMQVSGGQSVDCCYAFTLTDLVSPLTLTVRDNYSTFTDIGSTEIPIS